MSTPTSPEHAALSVLTSRLEQYADYLGDNAALDLAATQVLDEVQRMLRDVETARIVAQRLGASSEGCPSWCARHVSDGEGGTVHKAAVTVGQAEVELEHAPAESPQGTPILLPEWMDCDAPAARDLAAALIQAAGIIEGEGGQP